MTVKEHYDTHLGNFYSWMAGDFKLKQKEFSDFLLIHDIKPRAGGLAIDLGAGHGIQSSALAGLGFKVIAVDFNRQLLQELRQNTQGLQVEIAEQDIRDLAQFTARQPELIVCWGDTLTHLESKAEVTAFLKDISKTLAAQGRLLLSFRDYSTELTGNSRFIPVKSDTDRILTCVLEYNPGFVTVTDLLHEKTDGGWTQKISAYRKVRIATAEAVKTLEESGLKIIAAQAHGGLTTLIASKE
jgi:ubiquinone/menaquinone biosynthesis C-methylase UbiE